MTLPIFGPNELAPGETREPENVNGRFRIKCPDGKARLYTRCTTFIDVLEDKSVLDRWRQRVILVGLETAPDLLVAVAKTDPDDKETLNMIADQAFALGRGHEKANKGTDLHRLTYRWDTMQEIPYLGEPDFSDLKSWIELSYHYGFEFLHREERVVIDHLKVTGTPDGILGGYKCLDGQRRNVIMDVKTGRVDYGQGKMAQQLRLYAEGELYVDDGSDTGVRTPLPDVSKHVGVIVELPQGGAINGVKPTLYEVDLDVGWYGVNLSKSVRGWRNWSKRCFTEVPS